MYISHGIKSLYLILRQRDPSYSSPRWKAVAHHSVQNDPIAIPVYVMFSQVQGNWVLAYQRRQLHTR